MRQPAAACVLLCVLPASVIWGQTTFGSITGTITDQTGSLIPRAKVIVKNEGTSVERQVETNESGVFNVPNLNVGLYLVRIEAQGFRGYEQPGLSLNANQVISVDAQLAVAAQTMEAVQVTGSASVIDTETGTLSYVKSSRDLEQLPLVARSAGDFGIYGFTYMNPGVSKVAGQSNPSVNGMRILDTAPSMDGIAVMAYLDGIGGGPVQLSLEGVEQVNIELAGTQAEFARSANFTVVSKSGTNQFHGGGFYDYNGNDLNARNFFSATVPFRVYHNFGASLGGPIRKNKTFFFTDYEGSREAATSVIAGNTPLLPWRNGDFSTGVSKAIIDPASGQPFPNNQIPTNRISSVSAAAQNYFFPLPDYGPPTLQSGNWRGQRPGQTGYTHFDHVDGRVDHNLSNRDLIFSRFSYRRLPVLGQDNILPPAGHYDEIRATRSAVFSWTHSFSPSLINEFRAGMTRMRDYTNPGLIGANIVQQVGIQGIGVGTPIHGQPAFNITGITTTDQSDSNKLNLNTNFEWTDNLSLNRGSHFLKFGFDAIRDQLSKVSLPDDVYGTYNFTGAYTGFGYADFLLGIPQTTSRTIPTPQSYLRGTLWSLYGQDQYKLSRKLTLNFGLRWELQGPYYDRYGNIYSFDRANGSVVVPDGGVGNINPFYPKNIPIITASQAGYPGPSLLNFNKRNFYPRFGFAYKPLNNDRLVIRGGYGIYGNMINGSAASGMTGGPFAGSAAFTNAITNGVPLFNFPNPFLSVGAGATQNVIGINPVLKTPYSQQFNLTVEKQVGEIGIRVAYIGTRSVNLIYAANINQPLPSTIPFTTNRRIYPIYNTVTWYDNGGTQQYNALQVSASKTYGKNLFFNTGWTWAKDLTDDQNNGSSFSGPSIQNAYDLRSERGNNVLTRPHRIYVNTIYTLPVGKSQRFLTNANRLVDSVLGGWSMSWVAELMSGQYFTPTFTGFDPSNTNNFGPASSSNFVARPDRIGSGVLSSGQSINNWFAASAFSVPGCPNSNPVCSNPASVGRFGDSGVNILRGPDAINFDFSAMKYFRINERMRVQFRMIATNIFNHPSFSNPAANISSPGTVGQITSTFQEQIGEGSRQVHFSLRIEF
jgi:hypothetical protein